MGIITRLKDQYRDWRWRHAKHPRIGDHFTGIIMEGHVIGVVTKVHNKSFDFNIIQADENTVRRVALYRELYHEIIKETERRLPNLLTGMSTNHDFYEATFKDFRWLTPEEASAWEL